MRLGCHKIVTVIVAAVCATAGMVFAEQETHTLALFNIMPVNIEAVGPNGRMVSALMAQLGREPAIGVLERERMEAQLFSQGLSQSDDPEAVLQAGRALEADFVLFGSLEKSEERLLAQLQLMDVNRGRVRLRWDLNLNAGAALDPQVAPFADELKRTILDHEPGEPIEQKTWSESGAAVAEQEPAADVQQTRPDAPPQIETQTTVLERAQSAYRQRRWDEVVTLLEDYCRKRPQELEPNILLAKAYLQQCDRLKRDGDGRYRQLVFTPYGIAKRLYGAARYNETYLSEVLYVFAKSFYINHRPTKARRYIDKAVKLSSDPPQEMLDLRRQLHGAARD
jgi:hypothetical protein